ncbi:unnamed protein product, partial [Ceratitis capitata]
PLRDVLFSAKPEDLPSALAVAQELETSHKRYEFAEAFALGNAGKPYRPRPYQQNYQSTENKNQNINKPIPMEVDNGSSFYRQRNKFHLNVVMIEFYLTVTRFIKYR